MTEVDISNLDKIELLQRLWSNTITASFYSMQPWVKVPPFSIEKAKIAIFDSIDYFEGRPIKCNLTGNTVNPRLYNRDAGDNKFEEIVTQMRKEMIGKEIPLPLVRERKKITPNSFKERIMSSSTFLTLRVDNMEEFKLKAKLSGQRYLYQGNAAMPIDKDEYESSEEEVVDTQESITTDGEIALNFLKQRLQSGNSIYVESNDIHKIDANQTTQMMKIFTDHGYDMSQTTPIKFT